MKYKIGDRVQDADDGYGDIWEITGFDTNRKIYTVICVKSDENGDYPIGEVATFDLSSQYWKYLGNYAKTNKFEELYNLLNS